MLPDETLIKEGRASERDLFWVVFSWCCFYVLLTLGLISPISIALAELIIRPETTIVNVNQLPMVTRVPYSPDKAIKNLCNLFPMYLMYTFCLFIGLRKVIKDFLGNVIVLTDKRMIGIGNRCKSTSAGANVVGSGSSIDVPLDKIDNVLVNTNAKTVKRGSGSIVIGSGSQSFTFTCFQEPEAFKTLIMAQVDQKQKEATQLQIEQQEKLAQDQKVEAERLMLLQAEAMAKAMVEAQKQNPPNK